MPGKDPIVIVFAKKPEQGRVKTRMCPPLSEVQAKELAIYLTQKTIENISAYWPGKIELCVWPDSRDDVFTELVSRYAIDISTQVAGDLGVKMRIAMTRSVNSGRNAMIMGADVPHCSGEIIDSAYQALKSDKNVIGPSVDGGYYCIGVTNPKPAMFKNVSWGSSSAFTQTLSSCKDSGIEFGTILPCLNDLDTFEDLRKLSEQLPELRNFIDE